MIHSLSCLLWSFPALCTIAGIAVVVTGALRFVQIRYLGAALHRVFSAKKTGAIGEITPFQALVNVLGTNIGNGTIVGIPCAIAIGGPGAIFWMLVMAFFAMGLRYAEVYLGVSIRQENKNGETKGGPLVYLSKVPGGFILPLIYGGMYFCYSSIAGNAIQCRAVTDSISQAWGINIYYTALLLTAFIGYALMGGAARILKISDLLVPLKVSVFLLVTLITIGYNYANIIPALTLIIRGAFDPAAVMGAFTGVTVMAAMRMGMARSVFANEAGTGSAAMLFGATGSRNAVDDSIMSILGVFITTHVVGLLMGIAIVSSGAWNSGLSNAALAIATFGSVFGQWAGLIVAFLTMSFGLSVLVSCSFIAREVWLWLTNGRGYLVFVILFMGITAWGSVADTAQLWDIADIVNALLLAINLYAILVLLPTIMRGLRAFEKK